MIAKINNFWKKKNCLNLTNLVFPSTCFPMLLFSLFSYSFFFFFLLTFRTSHTKNTKKNKKKHIHKKHTQKHKTQHKKVDVAAFLLLFGPLLLLSWVHSLLCWCFCCCFCFWCSGAETKSEIKVAPHGNNVQHRKNCFTVKNTEHR